MCFPEYGVAVALRPGDVLLFNPQNYHCLLKRRLNTEAKAPMSMSPVLSQNGSSLNDNKMIALNEKKYIGD
jgi:hypothetical protein